MEPNRAVDPPAPPYAYERARLEAVRELAPFVSEDDEAMVAIAREATDACTAPIGIVSLMEEAEERILGIVGADRLTIARQDSICARAIQGPYVTVIEDLAEDPRFQGLPYVRGEPHVRFYAGAPILDATGLPLGAVCVLHTQPHHVSSECQRALGRLADVAAAVLESRRLLADAETRHVTREEMQSARSRFDALLITMIVPRPSCG